ncbi:MAG: hypothetical protein K0Q95_1681 [Bacteroidota bacterium]|jgi:hypothetical protein|nr:hypothetical protein [Bacteroidota bacterium]
MMNVLSQLASALGRRDEVPNQELAADLVKRDDERSVKELIDNLQNKNKDIRSDCIKVLYEIAEQKPSLISGYAKEFLALLSDRNNRLQWGAMTALDHISAENPKFIYENLPVILDVADKGSVITKDHAVSILIKLCGNKEYADDAFPLLIEQLITAPANQLPKYAEDASHLARPENSSLFVKALSGRLKDMEKDTKRKRVEKVISKLSK